MANPEIFNLFPEPVASYSLGREFTSPEKNALLNQEWRPSEGNQISKNTFVLRKKNLENIREFIRLSILDFGNKIYNFAEVDNSYQGPIVKDAKLYITQSWVNKTMPGEYHHQHNHPNSIVSGTFYIEANDGDMIQFAKPGNDISPWLFTPKQWNMWNCASWGVPVASGQLLLWRSHLPHSVPPTKGPNVRHALGVNTFIRGTIGENNSLSGLSLK
jgi:hypothetical protein